MIFFEVLLATPATSDRTRGAAVASGHFPQPCLYKKFTSMDDQVGMETICMTSYHTYASEAVRVRTYELSFKRKLCRNKS